MNIGDRGIPIPCPFCKRSSARLCPVPHTSGPCNPLMSTSCRTDLVSRVTLLPDVCVLDRPSYLCPRRLLQHLRRLTLTLVIFVKFMRHLTLNTTTITDSKSPTTTNPSLIPYSRVGFLIKSLDAFYSSKIVIHHRYPNLFSTIPISTTLNY